MDREAQSAGAEEALEQLNRNEQDPSFPFFLPDRKGLPETASRMPPTIKRLNISIGRHSEDNVEICCLISLPWTDD